MSNVGFIGVGYMGYGMAKNLLKKHNVFIYAHKNRKPINKLKKIGAIELKSYNEIKKQKLDCLMICVTNTHLGKSLFSVCTYFVCFLLIESKRIILG